MLKLITFFGFLIVFAVASNDKRFFSFYEYERNPNEFPSDLTDKAKRSTKYDLLVFNQMWPQTACWNLNHQWTNSTTACSPCDMPESKVHWTLHGLWPSSSIGKHPFFCNNVEFNVKLLNKALIAQMEERWPSFNLNSGNEKFWKHEWDKHGTCAMNLPSTNTLPKYFLKSIQLLNQYNIGMILSEAGILPGNQYDFNDVILVIEETLGVKVHVDCAAHLMSKKSYLHEIGICFNKNFELTNCPSDKSDCKGQVWYPEPRQECQKFKTI